MTITIFILIYLTLFIINEIAKRKLRWKTDTTRLCLHISTGFVSIFLPHFISVNGIIILAVVFTIGLIISRWKGILTSLHNVQRAGYGEIFFPIGIGIAAWFFLPSHLSGYTYALLNLTFGDALANWAGRIIPGRKIIFSKTIAGFLAFFVSSSIIGLWFYNFPAAIWRAGIFAVTELFSPRGTDNLTIILLSFIIA
jgi:dolichol kinase